MLTERDSAKRLVLQAAAERMDEIELSRRRDLAVRIHNALNGKV